MKIVLYGNGGSGNHGCEAIVRGTQSVINAEYIIQSKSVDEDTRYGLNADIRPAICDSPRKSEFISAYLKNKLTKNYTDLDGIQYLPAIRKLRGEAKLALSVGGDNYCYEGEAFYAYLNKAYIKNGFNTVLWGCSIEPEVASKPAVMADLGAYKAVVTRESITYNAVKELNSETYLAPDPAFFMVKEKRELPEIFSHGNVIGINASPMILSYEKHSGQAYNNYLNMLKYLLENTDFSIALIPHVVWSSNDDREVLKMLYNDLGKSKRVALVDDDSAPKLKYIISNCSCFVGARTHATIAAYSTCVPTLVVGYSVKARGIAKDLFGTEDGYVLPVQSLDAPDQLTQACKGLLDNKAAIKKNLESRIPEYKDTMKTTAERLLSLAKNTADLVISW